MPKIWSMVNETVQFGPVPQKSKICFPKIYCMHVQKNCNVVRVSWISVIVFYFVLLGAWQHK